MPSFTFPGLFLDFGFVFNGLLAHYFCAFDGRLGFLEYLRRTKRFIYLYADEK